MNLDRLHELLSGKKLGYVHDWLTVAGGAEEVLLRMEETVAGPITAAQFNPEKFPMLKPLGIEVRSHWISSMPWSKSKHYLYAPFLADVYRSMNIDELNVVVCTSHSFAHNVRPSADAIFYCYYHTPARSLWFPEIDDRAGSGWLRNKIVTRLKRLDRDASANPTYIVANSETTKARIESVYRRPVDEVIYPPVDIAKFADITRGSGDEGYLMYGRQIKYKRTDLAIEAAKKLGFKLNIVGNGPMVEQWQQLAAGNPNVVFHGRLPDKDLKQLLSVTRALLFPGYEDFGIVVVEALAAGLPVIAYRVGGASESVTAETGEFIQEQTVTSLCEAIERFEKRNFDPKIARASAERFSIENFQTQYAASLVRAIENGIARRVL